MKLLLLPFIFILSFTPSSSDHCNSHDKKALLKIKKSLNYPSILSSWNPHTDCCTNWTGIQCNRHRVTQLTISNGKISAAKIPAELGDLYHLRTLEFSFLSGLTGTIPPTITKLNNLEILRFTHTNLSGPIPDSISELKKVTFLDLSFNQFSGTIPSSLSRMPTLEAIQINDNKLTGSIPESFASFEGNVPNLYLFNNLLSGRIPESLSKLDFNAVDLSGNSFTGDGLMFFGQNKTTVRVNLAKNKLKFNLSNVQFAKSLLSIDLSNNLIFGRLPANLKELNGLEFFNVSYNRLCGPIPLGGRLQSFDESAYSHNLCLCGAPLKAC